MGPQGALAPQQGSVRSTMIMVIVIVEIILLMSLILRPAMAATTHLKTLCSTSIKIHPVI